MTKSIKSESSYYQHQPGLQGIVEKLALKAREKMFSSLMRLAQPHPDAQILDVGVTCDRRSDSNFFEKLYPYSHNITAVGLEDAYFLEQDFPGLKYIKADGLNLPFADKSFDLVVSFAVIEHVGSRSNQRQLIKELCRVGRTCCITTPNRWYPIELHTVLPFVHWLPLPWFRRILKWFGKDFWADENNLNPLSEKLLLAMLPEGVRVFTRHHRLFGLVSNLVFYIESVNSHNIQN